jgi:hypothetical protein
MNATTRPVSSSRTPAQEPAPTPAEAPAPTAPTADLPRNLARLTARAEAAGWTTTVETQPGHCVLLLTARQEARETVLRCVWRLTARGHRWDGATLTRYGQQAAEDLAWRAVGDLVAAEAPTARTEPTAPDLSMQVYGRQGAQPVTAEVVSASIATTPAGEVPVLLRPWVKAAIPVTLYPSRCVGRDYFGADCLLAPEGDQAAPDAAPVLSVLPPDYLTSNAAYLEDLGAYAVAEGRTREEAAAFARWVIASEIMTFGVYDSAYERWVRSLTCTMTAAYAVLTYSRMNGAALRLECGCGQRHPGWPWEGATVWNDEGCHYRSADTVPLDRIAELVAARGYQVTGDWSNGDVVRRVAVEPLPGPESGSAPDTEPSDPGTADAWESDGGACPGVEPPRGPEPSPRCTPLQSRTGCSAARSTRTSHSSAPFSATAPTAWRPAPAHRKATLPTPSPSPCTATG